MGRILLASALAAAALSTLPASSGGATMLGETESSNTACAAPSFIDVQTAAGPGVPSYTVPPGGGVITAWHHQARDIDSAQLKFKVVRPVTALAGPATFATVGASAFMPVPEPILYSYPVRIPVKAGDRLAVVTAANAAAAPPACNVGTAVPADEVYEGPEFATSGTLNPFNTFRLNVAATLEADADGDGFGDETQDKCGGKAGGKAGCPAEKKKCKKKKGKKRRSASAKKKKKKPKCAKKGKKRGRGK